MRSIILKTRPEGRAAADHFAVVDGAEPALPEGGVLLRLRHLSIDPYMRDRMNEGDTYVPAWQVGEVVDGDATAEVIASDMPGLAAGDLVQGFLPWAETVALTAEEAEGRDVSAIDTDGIPETAYLGVLGMPGRTAWVGMRGHGAPQAGETAFVSAASGTVGALAGQIAKSFGCRAVGSAGSDEKVAFLLDEAGFDAAFNYRTEPDLDAAIARCCPDGVDIDYENVGGPQMDAVLRHMNAHGRVVICGLVAHYDPPDARPGPPLAWVLEKSIRIQGFIVGNDPVWEREWQDDVGPRRVREGRVRYRETIVDGFANAPQALIDVLAGRNVGKQIVRVS